MDSLIIGGNCCISLWQDDAIITRYRINKLSLVGLLDVIMCVNMFPFTKITLEYNDGEHKILREVTQD